MEKKPDISVIIPNYNHYDFLEQRIESVINQNFENFEIIILDDFSTDNSKEIILKYKNHPKVSNCIFNSKNSGSVFKQWIKGSKLAKGKYIWIAESDDTAHKDFLKETFSLAESHKDLGLVFTASRIISENNQIQKRQLTVEGANSGLLIKSKEDVANYLLKKMIIANVSGVLFKKQALMNVNFDKLATFKNTGDRYTYIQIGLNYPIYYLNKTLNTYRNHSNNTTKKNIKNNSIFLDRLKIVSELQLEFCENKNNRDLLLNFFFKHFLSSLGAKFYKQLIGITRSFLKFKYIKVVDYIYIMSFILINEILQEKTPNKLRLHFKNRYEIK